MSVKNSAKDHDVDQLISLKKFKKRMNYCDKWKKYITKNNDSQRDSQAPKLQSRHNTKVGQSARENISELTAEEEKPSD